MDFTDELATFIGAEKTHNPYPHDDRPYNIFDTSSVSSTTSGFSDYHHPPPPPPFNSTLPALNSSMRYEPHPDPPYNPNVRHTPSPIHSQPGVHSPILPLHHHHHHHQHAHQQHINSRSRSRSRPPTSSSSNEGGGGASSSSAAAAASPPGSGIGPARTTRTRRNNSVSSTSPPPYGRPHAIVIPGSRTGATNSNGNTWFVSSQSSASDFSLPTPSSDIGPNSNSTHNAPPHSPLSQSHGFTPFGLSPPASESVLGFHNMSGHGIQHHPHGHGVHPHNHGQGHGHIPNHGHSHSQNHGYFTPSSSVPSIGGMNGHGGPTHGHGHGHHPVSNGNSSGSVSSSLPSTSLLGMGGSMGMGIGTLSFGLNGSSSNVNSNSNSASTSTLTSSTHPPSSTPTAASHTNSTSASQPTTATLTTSTLNPQDKQALLANEKRRRRRESHNAVERRRRDNINERISELATLIPECLLEGMGGTSTGGAPSSPTGASPSGTTLSSLPLEASASTDPLLPSLKKEDIKADDGMDGSNSADGGVVKANKGMILKKSVEYIRYLQQLVTAQGARNRELENELKSYRGQGQSPSVTASTDASTGTSAGGHAKSTTSSDGGDADREGDPDLDVDLDVDVDVENKEREHEHELSEVGSISGHDLDAAGNGNNANGSGVMDFGGLSSMHSVGVMGVGAFGMHPQMRRRGSSGVSRGGAGMLPSMPEHGEDEGENGGVMDVDLDLSADGEERGRTSVRGKRNGGMVGMGMGSIGIPHLKEEMSDDYAVHLGMVGMHH